ncbi:MAG: enoyl-CoA hydratase [Stellaceae bacterium]
MDGVLLERVEDGILTLTMNRPDRLNALSSEMCERLVEALSRAAQDRAVGAVLLTGAGRAFCAGGDVKAMADAQQDEAGYEERVADLRRRMEAARLLHEMAKPTIAMVRGPAAGAGLSLALACDLRIAGADARFITAFAKVGLSGDFGGHYFLTRIVGTAKARELYFLSPSVDAAAALEREALAMARTLADGPRVALGYMKQNLNLAEGASLAMVMDAEAMRHARCTATQDHREATAAFVEKRTPRFQGR